MEVRSDSFQVSEGEQHNEEKKSWSVRVWKVLEWLLLTVVVLLLLAFYSIPTVYFVNPPSVADFTQPNILVQDPAPNCSSSTQQFSGICASDTSLDIHTTEMSEETLSFFFGAMFPLFNPSPECGVAFRSFFCLHLFGACDDNSSVLATRETCTNVRDGVCEREWRAIRDFFKLPEYETAAVETQVNSSSPSRFNCSEFFYFDTFTGFCLPSCEWHPHVDQIPVEGAFAIVIFSSVIFLFFSIIIVLSALTPQRQVILKFPVICFYFLNLNFLVIEVTILLVININPCEQQFEGYIESAVNPDSLYCNVIGIIVNYMFISATFFLFTYASILFWSTNFPFSYREAKANGKLKYIFIFSIIISYALPLLSLSLLREGFFRTNFLNATCLPQNPTLLYVVITLPRCILLWLTSSLFILTIWRIFKDLIWTDQKKHIRAKLAEFKLLVIAIYFILVTVLGLVVQIYNASLTPNRYLGVLVPYFSCESTGHDESRDCRSLLSELQQTHLFNLSMTYVIPLGLLPFLLFLFITDFKLYIQVAKKLLKRH